MPTKKSQNVDSMRNFNRASVMKLVLENPGIDRSRLANKTGLTNAAMTRIVQELLNVDLLKETGSLKLKQGRGRRSTGLEIKHLIITIYFAFLTLTILKTLRLPNFCLITGQRSFSKNCIT